MDLTSFIRAFEELVELPSGQLTGAEKLEQVEGWDSVALISFLAMVDEKFGKTLSVLDVGKCETVADLYSLVSAS